MRLLLFSLLVVILVLAWIILSTKCDKIKVEKFSTDDYGPTLLVVGSVHGNEPAGSEAAIDVANLFKNGELNLKQGKIILITEGNPCGLKMRVRGVPHRTLLPTYDINRNFRQTNNIAYSGGGRCPISRQISDLAQESDVILDLHEAWGYVKENNGSMGSGIYYRYPGSSEIANAILEAINEDIVDEKKKFIATENWSQINTALEAAPSVEGKPYILIETSGQNDIQPLEVRKQQMKKAIFATLKQMNMI